MKIKAQNPTNTGNLVEILHNTNIIGKHKNPKERKNFVLLQLIQGPLNQLNLLSSKQTKFMDNITATWHIIKNM